MERLSLARVFQNAQTNITRNFGRLFQAQTQLATGRRINRPSDDLSGTRRLLSLGDDRAAVSRFIANVGVVRAQVQAGSSNLQELTGIVGRVREKTVQAASGTLSASDRANIAAEIDALLDNAVSVLNAQQEGRFLFGGTRTDTEPFVLVTGGDGLDRVDYHGNREVQQVDVAPGLRLGVNVPGSALLPPGPRGPTVFEGATGAAPGSGTDSGTGRDILAIEHVKTRFGAPPGPGGQDPATGLAPGASSPGGDTILGSSHTIALTTDAAGNGTISLNGGPNVTFTPADTDLQVTGPDGEVMFVDVSGLATNLPPGTTVPVQAEGTFSTDGGLSTVPIDFTASGQQVVDSETAAVLHVDSTGIRFTGTEEVTYSGTANLMETVISIRDLLLDDSVPQQEVNDRLNATLEDLDRGFDEVTQAITTLGARAAQLDSVEGRLGDLSVTLDTLRGEVQDADISKAVSDMQRFETLYQASLLMATRASRLSLLNFL